MRYTRVRAHALTLLCILIALAVPNKAQTHPPDLTALQPLVKLVEDSGRGLTGWAIGQEPCGAADCGSYSDNKTSVTACNFAGLACRGWRIYGM